MSVALQRISQLLTVSIGNVALNPLVTAGLLWVLTKGPPELRGQLTSRVAALRDPHSYAQILKALKWCLALGVTSVLNKQLNHVALNAGRFSTTWKSEKARWNWSQEVAVITGGCSGIGELVVKRLVDKGITVAVLDIQKLPPSLHGSGSIKFFACDITDPSAIYSTAEKINSTLGPPTILINNAGILATHTILNTSDEFLRRIFDVNVLSNWYTIKAFLPNMVKANKGHIITIASTASYAGVAGLADYGATKAAILSFHESLSQELKHHYAAPNVLTTSIHPGWVRTPLLAPMEQELKQRGAAIIEPKDVADAVVASVERCAGGHVFLPASLGGTTALLRGLPSWVQELVRDGVTKTIYKSAK
ncbi:dehydrogenase/reductase SDR family member 8 precursor [Cucurbitaria berberidis CBS 394.84]|uniref:Short-chain dehydrogenase/reductase 3 n=1 Tax=Cucurbitaria berberidis CBS 394.84 TaxID=1168544 RepID=A0A9P4GGC8_9PLEO|nr:dehydrogenase/reductase SDR family member 8 precursor [Cucurbitaria berberidis CBS 394.84]KAF1844675.1 dehydrogenase/reductase SDR family member 8 precursor [Cucurbitaria berberidis CBS 394.84]